MSAPMIAVRPTKVHKNRLRNRITIRMWKLRGLRSEDFTLTDLSPALIAYAVALFLSALVEPIPAWLAILAATALLALGYTLGLLVLPLTAEARMAVSDEVPKTFVDLVDDAQTILRLSDHRPSAAVLDAVSETLADVASANRYAPRRAVEELAPPELRQLLVDQLEAMAEEDK